MIRWAQTLIRHGAKLGLEDEAQINGLVPLPYWNATPNDPLYIAWCDFLKQVVLQEKEEEAEQQQHQHQEHKQ